jgi:hypothetical protein
MSSTRVTAFSTALAAIIAAALAIVIERHTAEPKLPEPGYLPGDALDALHRHMNHHGADMTELAWDVILLDYDATRARADRVAAEPALANGLTDGARLRQVLPNRFYQLQDDMLAAAVGLSQAALSRDSHAMATAYGRLATGCVDCHRVYLTGHDSP